MKKVWVGLVASMVMGSVAHGTMVKLEGVGSTTHTTGDRLDGVGSAGITTNVVEIAGLAITAGTGSSGHTLYSTPSDFGIESTVAGGTSETFDAGELMVFSFSQDVRIDQFDFNRFDSGESFTVGIVDIVGTTNEITIAYDSLDNKTSDVYDTNLVVTATDTILFSTTGSSQIGLDGLDIVAIPEPAVLGFLSFGAFGLLAARRCFML